MLFRCSRTVVRSAAQSGRSLNFLLLMPLTLVGINQKGLSFGFSYCACFFFDSVFKVQTVSISQEIPAWQCPTLPGRCRPSTIGAEGLNFCVRDGNRCDPFAIITRQTNRMLVLRVVHRTCTLLAEYPIYGGGKRDRTADLLLARQALSQLSYGPIKGMVGLSGLEPPTSPLSGVRSNQLS